MNRRTFLAGMAGRLAVSSECVGQSASGNNKSDMEVIANRKFSITDREPSGPFDDTPSVEFDPQADRVTIAGKTWKGNPRKAARLAHRQRSGATDRARHTTWRKRFATTARTMGMSDATNEFEFLGRQLLKKSRTAALRERMESFVAEHEQPEDIETLRRRVATGESLSAIVRQDRDERV